MASPLTHYIKQGDTDPILSATLTSESTAPWSLADASVYLNITAEGTGTTIRNRGVCTVVDATLHTVTYQPVSGDTAAPGAHPLEFVVVFADLSVERFPNSTNAIFRVTPQVGA